MRCELRNLAQRASGQDVQSELDQWEAVSSFVIAYVGAHRTFAPRTLVFKSPEHEEWCEAIVRAVRPDSGENNPYRTYIASNVHLREYLEDMRQQSLKDW